MRRENEERRNIISSYQINIMKKEIWKANQSNVENESNGIILISQKRNQWKKYQWYNQKIMRNINVMSKKYQ